MDCTQFIDIPSVCGFLCCLYFLYIYIVDEVFFVLYVYFKYIDWMTVFLVLVLLY